MRPEKTDQRNLILAIVISVAILAGFQFFVDKPTPPPARPVETSATAPSGTAPSVQAPGALASAPRDRAQVLSDNPRIRIDSPRVEGSVSLVGGRLDDLTLKNYRETVDAGSPNITLLEPAGSRNAYYAEVGWVAAGGDAVLPGPATRWTAEGAVQALTPEQPVTLTWDNGQGLKFIRQYALDRNFMVTVSQRVENSGQAAVSLFPYALVSRSGTPHTQDFFILHEGLIGVINGTLKEHKYKDIKDETNIEEPSRGGWLGITDKYWLVSLVPPQDEQIKTRFNHSAKDGQDRYQVDYLGEARQLAPGGAVEAVHRVFAGAKEVKLLEAYERDLNIARFDYAVDWGWFFFLTRPIFQLLDWLAPRIGNFGISILVLTVIIKGLFFPLANRSYKTMSKMKRLGPKMTEMREKYADDKVRLNQEMMALYKKEKVNPLAGCLPIVVQIPVFFSLYKVLFVTIEMRQAPFFGWIRDLSVPDPTSVWNLFGLIPWDPHLHLPAQVLLGAWPLIMGVTMFLQQRLNPAPPDPVQAKIFMLMPIVFTFMLGTFPAGLVIYWAWNNTLSILQQWVIMKRTGTA